jgi:hypothetical protein
LKPRLERALRNLGIRGDIVKTMHRVMSGAGSEPDGAGFALYSNQLTDPVVGRLIERGLHDGLKGTAYAIIDGIDGRTHDLGFSDLEMTGDAKLGAAVETRAFDDANGRKRLSLATRSDLAIEAQISAAGVTWLNRQLLAKDSVLSSGGFSAEVRATTDRRIDHLVEQDLARREGPRIVFTREIGLSLSKTPKLRNRREERKGLRRRLAGQRPQDPLWLACRS